MLWSASLLSSFRKSGDGGGFSTITWAVAGAFKPRESVQVALTVIGPGETPDVSRASVLLPLLETPPPLAVQPPTATGTLSGLVQVQLMVDGVPLGTVIGSAEHEKIGGFLGKSFTMKVVMQLPSPPCFIRGSEIFAVTS